MKTSLAAALFGAVLAVPASAAVIIDFDGLDSSSSQPVPLTSFSEDGYTFALTYAPLQRSDGPVIFNTFCTGYGGSDGCNGDIDLVPGVGNLTGGIQGQNGIAGNVLALQENTGNPPIPNDDVQGGTITFTLLSGKAFRLLGFSAVDDGRFIASTVADGNLGTVNNGIGSAFDNVTGSASFVSSLLGVGDTFSVFYSSSGGTDSYVLAPVPLPAALPLALAGFGLLGLAGRRRNRA